VSGRFGSFALGFATGALTVVAFRRLREIEWGQGYESLADEVKQNLEELEARIAPSLVSRPSNGGSASKKTGGSKRKSGKASG
jgi:hypothetical protein